MSHDFRGQARPRTSKRGWVGQPSTRHDIKTYDQHDREYIVPIDNKTGMPCGPHMPTFRAPWMPPLGAFAVNPDNPIETFVNYLPILRQRKVRLDEYHRNAVAAARQHKLEIPTFGEYSDEVIQYAGAPPLPIEPVIAAIQGNKFILGLTDKVDPRLERFVAKPADEALLGQYDFSDGDAGATVIDGASFQAAKRAASLFTEEEVAEMERLRLGDADPSALTPAVDAAGAGAATEDDETTADLDSAIEALEEELTADDLDALGDLEETEDQAALGGRVVKPQNTDRAARQAPRRPSASPVRRKQGAKRSANARSTAAQRQDQRAGRRTLADGAKPVIGGG